VKAAEAKLAKQPVGVTMRTVDSKEKAKIMNG